MFKHVDTFASFSVNDLAKAQAFYGQTLGLDVKEDKMGVLDIRTNDGMHIIAYPKPDHSPAAFTVLNFVVDNIDQAVDELAQSGVKFEKYDAIKQDDRGIARDEGPQIAWFKDPAGNILSVLQM